MKILITVTLSSILFAAACEDPAANKPKAETSQPAASKTVAANTAAAPANAARETLRIDPADSAVNFIGSKVTDSHEGGFKTFSGTIELVNADPTRSSVTVDIDTASVFSDDPKLTEHLKSADFFDVSKFPKATFKSTKIEPGASPPANYTVTGDLDLHGVTRSVRFPATITVADDAAAVNAEFSINRKDFGIVYAGQADNLIRDDVVIQLNVKAARKK